MSTENLKLTEAILKLKELAEDIKFALMATDLQAKPAHVIPMTTKEVDEDGNIWFLSDKNSTHNQNILTEGFAHLFYSKGTSMEFLSVYGQASIVTESAIIEKLYNKADDVWFGGVNDPNISAIKISPLQSHYWDTKNGIITTLFNLGLNIITGEKRDLGAQGELHI